MIFDIQKFNKEISGLRRLKGRGGLNPSQKQRLKGRVMEAIASGTISVEADLGAAKNPHTLIKYLAAVLLGLGLVGGTAFASSESVPGDLLYPVKRAKEKVELAAAVSMDSKAKVEAKIAEARLKELSVLRAKANARPGHAVVAQPALVNIGGQDDFQSQTGTSTDLDVEINVQAKAGDKAKIEARVRIQAHAMEEAQAQVKKALDVLNEAQAKLEAKGKTEAAASLNKNRDSLKEKAEAQIGYKFNDRGDLKDDELKNKDKDDNSKNEKNNEDKKGSGDSQIEVRVKGTRTEIKQNIKDLKDEVEQKVDVKVKTDGVRDLGL